MKPLLIFVGLLLSQLINGFGQNACEMNKQNKTADDFIQEAKCYLEKNNCATAKLKLFSAAGNINLKNNALAIQIRGCKLPKPKPQVAEAELAEAGLAEVVVDFNPATENLIRLGSSDIGSSNVTYGNSEFRKGNYRNALDYYSTYLRENENIFRSSDYRVQRNFLEKIEYCINKL